MEYIERTAPDELSAKRETARMRLRERGPVVVALSGGVDSAVLLALALEALGPERVLAVTGRSAALAPAELESARAVAKRLGARHEVVETHELVRAGYRANAGDRCFHCRTELFVVLAGIARRVGFQHVAYGAILDDVGEVRPGMQAAAEHGIVAPLLDAAMTKADVRALAARLGLEVHDKPANPCLASRIPVGTPVSVERLERVERAESALARLGFRQLRVRDHSPVARLELDAAGERLLASRDTRNAVVAALHDAGFRFVALDLEGYRSGSVAGSESSSNPESGQ